MLSPEQLFAEYPSDPAQVEAHKKRMMAEVRAYRLKELRKELQITQVELAQLQYLFQLLNGIGTSVTFSVCDTSVRVATIIRV